MSFIFGSNSGGGGGSTSGTQVNIAREAPEVEGRKLALYDQAAKLAAQPVSLPGIQVAPTTACLLYTSPSPRDGLLSRMPSSA